MGAVISHFAAVSRDRATAKKASKDRLFRFRGAIKKFRCIMYRSTNLTDDYTKIAPDIAFECGLVMADIGQDVELIRLCEKADSFRAQEYQDSKDPETWSNGLTKHFDKMIQSIDAILLTKA